MNTPLLSRRAFLNSVGQAAQRSCIALTLPALLSACDRANESRNTGEDFVNFSAIEAEELRAIASRIMPTDETPGAEEAGVIYFIDTVVTETEQQQLLRDGMTSLQDRAGEIQGVAYFYELDNDSQDSLLREIEDGPFFGTMRFLTMAGMFTLPEYGGNRNHAGYEAIGFENRQNWTPPFGFYDENYQGGGQ